MPRAVVGPRAVVKPGASSSHGTEGLECAAPESATMPPLATADSPNGRAADNDPPSGKATATPNGSAPATNEPVGLSSVSLGVPAPVPTEAGRLERIYEACLYLVFGLASGWTLVDAMMIQTARMGQTQPEGLALATVLGGWGTLANLLVVPGFYYLQARTGPPPRRRPGPLCSPLLRYTAHHREWCRALGLGCPSAPRVTSRCRGRLPPRSHLRPS